MGAARRSNGALRYEEALSGRRTYSTTLWGEEKACLYFDTVCGLFTRLESVCVRVCCPEDPIPLSSHRLVRLDKVKQVLQHASMRGAEVVFL